MGKQGEIQENMTGTKLRIGASVTLLVLGIVALIAGICILVFLPQIVDEKVKDVSNILVFPRLESRKEFLLTLW